MGYRNLRQCVDDLESRGQLVRINVELDPELEIGAVQRRVYRAAGPALLFTRVKGCPFPMLGNLFGSRHRLRFIFRDTLPVLEEIARLRRDPVRCYSNILSTLRLPLHLLNLFPKTVRSAPVLACRTAISSLPHLKSWPADGGAFITLPQVYTEDPLRPGWRHSNMGMYRIQLSGGQYRPDEEVGIHYQIHRGIAGHHAEALRQGTPLPVSVFVGGPPALTVAAVMPLPEDMPELAFAGLLGGRRIALAHRPGLLPMPAETDFCITGYLDPGRILPEGPFGDHIGYYSLCHEFPVIRVTNVFHRPDAIWPFTTVGRPPQEDSVLGEFIHELTGPLIPAVVPGVSAVHAVDASGVHALLLAAGAERYVPYSLQRRPMELLTLAHALLGQGQLSLSKYLIIAAGEDDPSLDPHHVESFFRHILQRVDWQRDLHFQTASTMDTLDYTGTGLNQGSKVIIAVAGPVIRSLATALPVDFTLPEGFCKPRICMPGVLAVQSLPSEGSAVCGGTVEQLASFHADRAAVEGFPLLVLVDDSDFTSRTLDNFLWVTFTRSNPASDISGIGAFSHAKHWGCTGSLIIDARIKPHHAPALADDPAVERRVDALGAPGGPLHGII